MKVIDLKSTLIGAAVVLSLTGGMAYAGLFDSIRTNHWPTIETTSTYKVEVLDFNVRAYEWVSAEDPDVRIVFVAGNESSGTTSYRVSEQAKAAE